MNQEEINNSRNSWNEEIAKKWDKYRCDFEIKLLYKLVDEYNKLGIDITIVENPHNYRFEVFYNDHVISFFGFGYDDMERMHGERHGSSNFEGGTRGACEYGDIDVGTYVRFEAERKLSECFNNIIPFTRGGRRRYTESYAFSIDDYRVRISSFSTDIIDDTIKHKKMDIWGIHRRNELFADIIADCMSGKEGAASFKTVDARVRYLYDEISMREEQLTWLYIELGLLMCNTHKGDIDETIHNARQ